MPTYRTPLEDMRFVLHDLLDVAQLGQLPGYEEVTQEVVDAVLSEGARLAETVLQPLNQSGDAAGCRFENGVVRTPQGFPDAYARYAAGGWPGLACEPAYGGQGLPHVLGFVMDEVLSAANMAFEVFPGLTHGAYNTIAAHGDQDLKATYLPKLADGSWTGTMNPSFPSSMTSSAPLSAVATIGKAAAAASIRASARPSSTLGRQKISAFASSSAIRSRDTGPRTEIDRSG